MWTSFPRSIRSWSYDYKRLSIYYAKMGDIFYSSLTDECRNILGLLLCMHDEAKVILWKRWLTSWWKSSHIRSSLHFQWPSTVSPKTATPPLYLIAIRKFSLFLSGQLTSLITAHCAANAIPILALNVCFRSMYFPTQPAAATAEGQSFPTALPYDSGVIG